MVSKAVAIAVIAAIAAVVVVGAVAYYLWSLTHPRNPYAPIEDLIKGVPRFNVSSPVLKGVWLIPARYTCDGADISPSLSWGPLPKGVKSLLVIMYDPDAPKGVFYHWILYDIPPNVTYLPPAIPPKPVTRYGIQGINSFGTYGYGGPCPPPGSTHRYVVVVLALNTTLKLRKPATAEEVLHAARGHVVGYAVLISHYRRS